MNGHAPGEPEPHPDLKGSPEGTVPASAEIDRLYRELVGSRRCERCGGGMKHTRLNGYVCLRGCRP